MKLIRPLTLGADGYGITTGMLTSSTIAEPAAGEAAWNALTSYNLGDLVIRTATHRVYRSLASGVHAGTPEATPTRWEDIGPTQRWAMFDKVVGTVSSVASPLTIVTRPGTINSVSLLGLKASAVRVTMKDVPGGTTVYDSGTISLLSDESVADWYMYFFEPISGRLTLTLTNLPPYTAGEVTVAITGSGTVECGTCYFGNSFEMGDAEYGASVGIIDYSNKTVAADGRITVTEGAYRDRANLTLYLPSGRVDVLKRTLTAYRATPLMWVGVDGSYEALTLFGFFKDFSVVIAYPTMSTCSLEIEGLV